MLLPTAFGTGFMLSASFIIAIGSQNAYVLQQGLRRQHIGAVVALCIIGDATLILAGAFGFGHMLQQWPLLTPVVTAGGAFFLTAYGLRAARRATALFHPALDTAEKPSQSLRVVMLTTAAFTFLNPHVYLDTVILLGTLASTYKGIERNIFALGAITASTLWFVLLGYGARLLRPVFAKPLAWRILDGVIAISMLMIAGHLWFSAYAAFLNPSHTP